MTSSSIHFVQGLRFSCTGCGKCCHNDWDLLVTKEKAESIQETELFAEKVRQGFTPLRVLDELFVLGTRDTGGCVFLDGELCELHRDLGPESKPLGCQLFPLNLVQAPDGYHVSLSFACPAVLAGVGTPIDERREWLSKFITSENDIPPLCVVPEQISVSLHREIPYNEYLELEAKLVACLDDSLCPQGIINWACTMLEEGPKFSVDAWSPLKVCPLLEEALQLLDLFGRSIVGIMELEGSPNEREAYIQSLTEDYLGRSLRTGAAFPNFAFYRPPSEMARAVIVKFFRSQFLGKRLLTGQTVVSRLLAFGTALAVICYYLEAQAREYKSLHFSFEHLEKAFAIVEENVLTHSEDLEPFFLKYEEALAEILGCSEEEPLEPTVV